MNEFENILFNLNKRVATNENYGTDEKINKLKNLIGFIHDKVNQEYKDKLTQHGINGEKLNQVLKNIGLIHLVKDNG